MKIRDFRPADSDTIVRFKEESNKVSFPGASFDRRMYRNLLERSAAAAPAFIKVAEADGETAGFVWFREIKSTVGTFGRIEDLFVDGSHRGKGIGKALMKAAEDTLKASGVGKLKLTVTISNSVGLSLYEKLGYRTTRYRMEKDL